MMSKPSSSEYVRPYAVTLKGRLEEECRFIQVVTGARQTGKTTLVLQALAQLGGLSHYVSADEPTLQSGEWLGQHWERARLLARQAGAEGSILAIDEIQKIPGWAESVKRLWDEDSRMKNAVQVVLLGSAPLLVERGLTESLAGRFETIHVPHWSFSEMRAAFGFDLEHYLYYGGYPGAAPLVQDPDRWRRYIMDSLIETSIARDVLLLTRVDKPALLRRLFELCCRHSGQILSYTKMQGQLQDAGNTTTLAHYLDLLRSAGMVRGLGKFAKPGQRSRASSPKLQVMNNALMTAQSGVHLEEALEDRPFWGRLVESALGAHLANAAATGCCELFYWRERNREVDFVLRSGETLVALEIKSGSRTSSLPGMSEFARSFHPQRSLLVGGNGIPLAEFLEQPVSHWLQP
jgi:uncharacterized protein